MPNIRDLLPPPPWKGPPIPSFLLRKEEYIAPPLELEADLSRGVIYLHDTTTGTTILRICRVPSEVMDRIPSYGAELNLETAIPYLGRRRERVFKKSPVFLEVSKILEEMTVVGEGGEIILEVYNIPRVHWKTLQTTLSSNREKVEFTDITVG